MTNISEPKFEVWAARDGYKRYSSTYPTLNEAKYAACDFAQRALGYGLITVEKFWIDGYNIAQREIVFHV
jgi:hypothetical protein